MMKVRDLEKAESKPRSSQSEGKKKRREKKWRKWESNATSTVTKPKCKYLRRIPRIAIHFCPKMVTFESGPKVVAIDEIW